MSNFSAEGSNNKCMSSSGILGTTMNLSSPTYTMLHASSQHLTVASEPTLFACNNGANPVFVWCFIAEARCQQLVRYSMHRIMCPWGLDHLKLYADDLWNKTWCPIVFQETMLHGKCSIFHI
ncbi:hypothetical protein TNCT_83041 [Trichonephila clavata]|uniref:Uncharacterized protein n=1 Tax=Trichonephila clavata TaxID=2740835 RepID=A0A8X6LA77_TRICU|nr:hypothetical protein TNCT_83041 [Trichonephila clavata]